MTKATMIQELANKGMYIYGDRKMLKADVERYYTARIKEEENMTTETTIVAENTEIQAPATQNTENTNKEDKNMTENTQATTATQNTEATEEKKVNARATKKEEVMKAADAWLAGYADRTPGAEVKIWPATPNNRKLVVNGKAFYEIIISCNGIFLNGKSEYIPEDQRPEGSYIVKNGLDLCMKNLTVEDMARFTAMCETAVAAKAEAKAKAEAAKKEAAAKAKAEKEAAKKAAREAKEAAKAEEKARKAAEKEAAKKAKAEAKAE